MKHTKEKTHGSTNGITVDPFSKFIGRLETEIEVYAHYVLGCAPEELTARVGAALVGAVSQQGLDVAALPTVPVRQTAGIHQRLRQVAVRNGPRAGGSRRGHAQASGASPTSPHSPVNGVWARFKTPAQRKAEMKRRQRMWSPEARARWNHKKPSKMAKAQRARRLREKQATLK